MMIAIIDYGMGNKHSVYNALKYIGVDACISRNANEISKAEKIILPGVGAFGAAMENLRQFGLTEILNEEVIIKGKPFLGICLGMQLLAEKGTEKGFFQGLGWIAGDVLKLQPEDTGLKLPHVGWNDIELVKDVALFKGLRKERAFYFVHSYAIQLKNSQDLVAESDYGVKFTAAVQKDNIFATQFHPEKSQKNGLIVLENFINWRV
jgi:glutamine amidotransferase